MDPLLKYIVCLSVYLFWIFRYLSKVKTYNCVHYVVCYNIRIGWIIVVYYSNIEWEYTESNIVVLLSEMKYKFVFNMTLFYYKNLILWFDYLINYFGIIYSQYNAVNNSNGNYCFEYEIHYLYKDVFLLYNVITLK